MTLLSLTDELSFETMTLIETRSVAVNNADPAVTDPAARPQAFSVPVNGLRLTWHGRLGPVRRCQVAAATNKLSALAGVEASRGAFLAS